MKAGTATADIAVDLARMPTLAEIAPYHAQIRPGAIALSFEGRLTSYGELDVHVRRVADALAAAGIRAGERIAYIGKNSDHYFELLLGAASRGVVMVPVGSRLAPSEIGYILQDCEPKLIFAGSEVTDKVHIALGALRDMPHVIAMEPDGDSGGEDFAAWRDRAKPVSAWPAPGADAVAVQIYTSGTTGRPKGAMLSHANLLRGRRAAAEARLPWNIWGPDDVSLVAMPISHIGGTAWGVMGLWNGAKSVVAREFDPTRVLDFIEHDGVSKMFIVPSALDIVLHQPRVREIDYGRLRYIHYGASPIPLKLLRECMDVFGCGFVQVYGMTESAGTVVSLPPEDHDPAGNRRMRSVGLPMPGVEICIVDDDGRRLPPGEAGEVAIHSPSNMIGYWGMAEATAATIGADGWLRTGDAGYLDEDGYLFIHDRKKDMIISGGENIYPAEVENAIHDHPQVAEVAVIGVPDERWGEAVKAIVVPKPGAIVDEGDLIAFVRERIAAFKAPKSIDFIDALPRNASGKVLRRELREPYWMGKERTAG